LKRLLLKNNEIVYDEKCNTEEPQQTEIKIVREKGLDKFYTIPTCSKKCIDKICELYDIKKMGFNS